MKEYIGKWWKHSDSNYYYIKNIKQKNDMIMFSGSTAGLNDKSEVEILDISFNYFYIKHIEFLDKLKEANNSKFNKGLIKYIFGDNP